MPVPIIAAGIGAVATIGAARSQAGAQRRVAEAQENSSAQMAQAQMQASREAAASHVQATQIQADALRAQAQASLEAARITSDAQLKATEMQKEAAIKASRDAMKAAIQSAALNQEQRIEQVVRRLPIESGAATLASFDQAQQWEQYRNMMMYQDVAKEYFAGGKDGRILHGDPTWNMMNMTKQLRDTTQSAVELVGVRSASNPAGVPVSWEDYRDLYSLKDPESLLKVDPQAQQMYEQNYARWRADMSKTPEGAMIVKLYENPQLAGQGIEGLLGTKAPIQVDDDGNVSGGKYTSPNVGVIDKLKQMGVIDANNMINGGEILNHIPAELRKPPQFDPRRELTPQEEARLRDRYNQLSQGTKWDPKLVRQEYLGYGVTRHTYYNADGSVAHQFMSGEMAMADGSMSGQVMIQGGSLSEWDRFKALADGMGPSFVGEFRLGSNDFDPTQIAKGGMSINAKSRSSAEGEQAQAQQLQAPAGASSRSAPSSPNLYQSQGAGNTAPQATGTSKSAPVNQRTGTQISGLSRNLGAPSTPAGYEGAPLAAGD